MLTPGIREIHLASRFRDSRLKLVLRSEKTFPCRAYPSSLYPGSHPSCQSAAPFLPSCLTTLFLDEEDRERASERVSERASERTNWRSSGELSG